MGVPLNIDWQQILLHAFNLIILTGGLYFLLYQPVTAFMKKRQDYYAGLEADAQAKLREANEQIGALVSNAVDKLVSDADDPYADFLHAVKRGA